MEYKVVTVPAEWKPAPRVCRCCLSEGCYKDISTEYYWLGEKEMYSQMLKECFDLTISLSEAAGSSRLICEVCITRLRDASNFKKQVINSEKRFAEHLRSGASLSVVEAQETPVILDIKVEGVKDEAAISDDDPDPVDDDIADPDYDESDDLPLKFEVQKKESMTELSFGDEIPALNTSETTIKKVSSKTKDKSALKKLKMNKRELTIKPVKASTSKKKDKVAKTKVKAAKPGAKKGEEPPVGSEVKMESGKAPSARKMSKNDMDKMIAMRASAVGILEYSLVCPFRWQKNSYGCFYCEKFFSDPEILREHNYAAHKFPNVAKAMKKIKKSQMIKIDITCVNCRLCKVKIDNFTVLKSHIFNAHDKFIDEKYSDGCLPFKLTSGTLNCQLCDESFVEFKTINQHMNLHFRNFICETCGAGFVTPERLKVHSHSHETNSIPCEECNKVFRSYFAKNEHVANVHRQVKRHRCPHCSEAFRNYFQRNKHITSVHNVKCKEHNCSVCDKSFSSSGKLTHHVKTVHLKEKRHACNICSWQVYSKSELNDHMIRHNGARIHQCTICKKAYARKYTLREHMRIHNNDRRFICSVCGKAFVQNCSLKHHMKVHHPSVQQNQDIRNDSASVLYLQRIYP